ncbi:hypothetical protein [Pseudomonas sp. PS01302]|uniref:hypothetical protein n=1 Tax=Pseudomonas sp. PS01302 TaxID=2991438 RepID=UPI00249B7167|nr:hypothetical protein [Pseudomonas sp. PS01302]
MEEQRAIAARIEQVVKVGTLMTVRTILHGHAVIVRRSSTLHPSSTLTNHWPEQHHEHGK